MEVGAVFGVPRMKLGIQGQKVLKKDGDGMGVGRRRHLSSIGDTFSKNDL